MKILFNRPIKEQAWGGGSHFITSLYYYLVKKGIEVTFNFEDNIDLIFMFEPRILISQDMHTAFHHMTRHGE